MARIAIDTGGHPLSILYGLGAHTITVNDARWDTVLANCPAVEIGGQMRPPATYFELDIAPVGGLFPPGATGRIVVGKAVPNHLAAKTLVLTCERGRVLLEFPHGLRIQDHRNSPLTYALSPTYASQPYVNVLKRFLGLMQVGGPPETTLDIALACLRTIFAAYAMCHRTDFYAHSQAPPEGGVM